MNPLLIKTLFSRPSFWLGLFGSGIWLLIPGFDHVDRTDDFFETITPSQIFALKLAVMSACAIGWIVSQLNTAHGSMTISLLVPNLRDRFVARTLWLGGIVSILPALIYHFKGGSVPWYCILFINTALFMSQLSHPSAHRHGWRNWACTLEKWVSNLIFIAAFVLLLSPAKLLTQITQHAPWIYVFCVVFTVQKITSFINRNNWRQHALNPSLTISYSDPTTLPPELQPKHVPKLRSFRGSDKKRPPTAFTFMRAIWIENPKKLPWLGLPILLTLMHVFFFVEAIKGHTESTPHKPLLSSVLFWFMACGALMATPVTPKLINSRTVSRQTFADGIFLFSLSLAGWIACSSLLISCLPELLRWPRSTLPNNLLNFGNHSLSAFAGLPFIFIISIWHQERTLTVDYLLHLIGTMIAGVLLMVNFGADFFPAEQLLPINLLLAVFTHSLFRLWLRRHYTRVDLLASTTA